MKTFKEFQDITYLIIEKYYPPDEKLPGSGKSPVEKTTDKILSIPDTPQTPYKVRERRADLKRKLRTKVSHGADNPEINTHSSSGVMVHQSKDKKSTEIDNPRAGIYFEITRKNDINGKPHHEINWNRSRLVRSDKDATQMALTARRMYERDVQPRLPHGTVISNQPASKKLGRIYRKNYGFGPVDSSYGYRQFATVGREPSPRQKARGKRTRLKPFTPG